MSPMDFNYSRCAGRQVGGDALPRIADECNDCRRREPGHPTEQVFIGPYLLDGACVNRIPPLQSKE